mmetsp:Transcript_13770/g.17973  ORF Transcript_13770/g.17973 Transcript_13770/m.17973 type:complete len:207 (+) Transcript_13770:108-728(+)|eukprot:CAMPEP_0198142060 /NCGR_PEP_ID=MMETSP1443-20131203/4958_1 /TAXON_ID=186043 /ORGANISM="Entomoneis sp., Strain CCMP2396" /LENGTH=206 /DNA_ID=CAMNT_0043805001 /DNA_START=74 /DNA_END=694 /DNA_ORIENTATION=-
MKYTATLLALASTVSAFAPVAQQSTSTALNVVLDGMPGSSAPLKKFDPLGYAQVGSDETFAWFRASELKHGRVAMLATTGYLVQAAGVHFPGLLSHDVTFESLSGMNPLDQWAAVPDAGKWQIIGAIFIAEIYAESEKPHYMMGGPTPALIWPKIDTSSVSESAMATKQTRELNNGRLAMIAIMSFLAEKAISGAVPVLSGIEAFH